MSSTRTISAAAPTAASSPRWIGLDALRGLSIAAMILVNNPGDWGHIYAPLRHAKWHGCTPTDLVFPTFLFVAGVAIVPALRRALAQGHTPAELLPRILRRVVLLILFGWLLSAFPLVTFAPGKSLFDPLLSLRVPGVLQRIGVCYGIAAVLFLWTRPPTWRLVGILCLLVYWPLLALVPTPDGGAPNLDDQGDHLAGWLDRTLFGEHIWVKGKYDPEGLLSTIPSLATTLLGMHAGTVLTGPGDRRGHVRLLMLTGLIATAIGWLWGLWFPINKALWTSSFALYTGGIALCLLGGCVWLFELLPFARWSLPLRIYGVNALLVFVASGLLARTVSRLITVVDGDGKSRSLQAWSYQSCFASWAEPHFASLCWAVCWMLAWFVVLWLLWRRGIVLKV